MSENFVLELALKNFENCGFVPQYVFNYGVLFLGMMLGFTLGLILGLYINTILQQIKLKILKDEVKRMR